MDEKKSLCIVLCSKGYPDKYKNNIEIKNLDKIKLDKNEFIFHAGTKKENNQNFFKWWKSSKFCNLYQRILKKVEKIILNY